MLTPERITDLPTAEELESGYYVLVDSPTLGTRKIAVENFIPPENYLYKWDFTKSVDPLVDEIEGAEIELFNGATRDSNGIIINNTSQYVKIPVALNVNNIYEIDFSNCSKDFGNAQDGRIIALSNRYFCWSYQLKWFVYEDRDLYDDSGSEYNNDVTILNGKTLKILWDNEQKLCAYADDTLFYKCPQANKLITSRLFYIGGYNNYGFKNMTITGIRIYENEEV